MCLLELNKEDQAVIINALEYALEEEEGIFDDQIERAKEILEILKD